MVTTGSQEALAKSLELILDPGDTIIVEDFTYPTALSGLRAIGAKFATVKTDSDGIIPEELDNVLSVVTAIGIKIKAIYTIPTGQNPSGSTLTNARRTAVYQICRKYNIIILEDDPYWFLKLNSRNTEQTRENFKSFISMDEDARVLRFDSFSKVISSGLRLGFVTGPNYLVERLQLHQQTSSLHTSGLSQAILTLLLEKWGPNGFSEHVTKVEKFYSEKRNIFLNCAEKHLTGLAEWNTPSAGMFVWIKLLNIADSDKLITEKAVNAKVLFLPGKAFSANKVPSPYVRASFSTATTEEIDEALRRLSVLLKEETRTN